MVEKKREIFIKVDKVNEIISLLEEIKNKEEYIRDLFLNYDKLNLEENKRFENWNNYLDDIVQKLDHVTL